MKLGEQLPSHRRPCLELNFRTHAAAVAYVLAPIGFIISLYPGIVDNSALKITVVVLCVLVALAGLAWSYIVGNLRSLYGRVRDYPQLHGRATTDSDSLNGLTEDTLELMLSSSSIEQEDEKIISVEPETELQRLKKGILQLATKALVERSFRIMRQSLDRGKLVIVLENREALLAKGDKVRVIDTSDLYEMGTFEVVEEGDEQCYAVGGKDVDNLWLGDIKETGETSVIVGKVAILVERIDDNND